MKEQLIEELIKDENEEIDFVELSSELEEWIVKNPIHNPNLEHRMKIELSRLLSTPFMAVNDEDENEVVFCLTDIDGELPEGFYDDNEEFDDEEDGYEIISNYGTLWRKL